MGTWIRNEFGLNGKINSKLIYDCYTSEFNNEKIGKIGPLLMADAASPIILKELWAEVHRKYDKIKKHKLSGEIDKGKYMLTRFK